MISFVKNRVMVESGFYALSLIMLTSPFWLVLKGKLAAYRVHYVIGTIVWLSYTVGLSISGVLNNFSFPPRVPLLIVLPIILFGIWVSGRPLAREQLLKLAPHSLIYIQSFRIIVEFLIYGGFRNGIYPQLVTFEGINLDILVGFSALLTGYLSQKGLIARNGILAWNFIALGVLSVTVYAFISTFYFSDFENKRIFAELPYILLPSVLLNFAIFYHIMSIRQQLIRAA